MSAEVPEVVREERKAVFRSAVMLWMMLALTMVGLAALAAYALFPRAPATFHDVTLETRVVQRAGEAVAQGGPGVVRIRATVQSPLDPGCLGSTQFFVKFADGSMWSLPGARWNTEGEFKAAIYQAPIPRLSPLGHATFTVRDTYSCGIRVQRVQSPPVIFEIVDVVPGVTE